MPWVVIKFFRYLLGWFNSSYLFSLLKLIAAAFWYVWYIPAFSQVFRRNPHKGFRAPSLQWFLFCCLNSQILAPLATPKYELSLGNCPQAESQGEHGFACEFPFSPRLQFCTNCCLVSENSCFIFCWVLWLYSFCQKWSVCLGTNLFIL